MARNLPPNGPRAPSTASTVASRDVAKWCAAFALFVALLALFTSLQLFHLTAEDPAKRTLRRSIATLAEIDPLLDRHFDEVQRSAQNAGPGDPVALRDFPIDVPLARGEVIGASHAQLRSVLLDRGADVLYEHGTGSLRSAGTGDGSAGRFSSGGLTQHGLGFLRSRNHDALAFSTWILAVLCVGLAITLGSTCRGFGRLGSVGATIVAASTPVLVAGISARVFTRMTADADTEYVRREFLKISEGLAWIPIRDGAAFATAGLLLLVTGIACATWADRRAASDIPDVGH